MIGIDGRMTSWNAGVSHVLGWEEAQWIGQPFSVILPPEDVAEGAAEAELEQARVRGCAEDDRWQIKRNGTKFWASGITTAQHDGDGRLIGFLKVMRDLTEQKRAEIRQATQHAVTAVIAEESNLKDAVPKLLQAMCNASDWRWGAIWAVDAAAGVLRLVNFWVDPSDRLAEFEQHSQHSTFARGVGLPGRVWASAAPAWVADVSKDGNFPRAAVAAREGLHGALCFPVLWRGEVSAVMEFFSGEVRTPDEQMMGMMALIGGQIGQFIDRNRTEDRLWAQKARHAASIQAALDCIISMDHEGNVTEWNPAAERTFGYGRDEVLGREMASLIIPLSYRQPHREGLARYFATGEGPVLGKRFETTAVRKDGSEFPIELTIIRLPAEGPPAFTGYIRDITDQKRANEARRMSAFRWQRLVEQSPLSTQVFAPDGSVRQVNRAWERLWGVTLADLPSYNILQDQQLVEQGIMPLILRAFEGESVTADPIPYIPDRGEYAGRVRWCGVYVYPVKDDTGRVEEVVLVHNDVTESKLAEEQLARDAMLLANVRDSVIVMDLIGVITFWNDGATRLFGWTAEEMVGRPYAERVPEQFRGAVTDWIGRIAAGEDEFNGEWPDQRKDGSVVWIEATTRLIADTEGKPLGIMGVARDISERKRAEAEIARARGEAERSLTQWRAVVESMTEGLVLADAQGNLLSMNPAALAIHEFDSVDDMVKRFADYPELFELHDEHGQSVALNDWPISRVLRGEGFSGYEVEVQRRDTGKRWIGSYGGRSVRDDSGRITLAVLTLRDITEQKHAEAAVAESEARFRQLAETIPQLAWMAKPDGWIFWYNRRWYEYTGTTPQQMEGWGWQSVHDPAELPRVVERWQHSIGTGEPFEMEFPLKDTQGRFRWFLTRVAPLRDGEGRITFWFGTNTDIEDRRRVADERAQLLEAERNARVEAERAGRMKDEFLATLSHELRTPLNAILGWSQILASGSREDEDFAEGLRIIERNARVQTQIIADLLDMSRIVSGKVRLDVQRLDIAPVLKAAVETVRPTADAKGVRVQTVLDPLAGPVSGDPGRLQQVFWNLLTNAIKFTGKGGRVQILLERVNSHLEISVTDSGQGIAPEFLPHVFDRFRQADASTTRQYGGLGLGLAIVKQLAELHGGTVRAKSAGPGHGSTFTVSLPLTVVHPEPTPESARRHPAAGAEQRITEDHCGQLHGINVLVVDDEPDARALLRRLLEDCHAIVTTAASVSEALDRFKENRPDVLVSDIGMPGEDGYLLIGRIRALSSERGGNVPAVALTAYARSEDRTRSIRAGFQMHLAKPVEHAELIAVVASLASRIPASQ